VRTGNGPGVFYSVGIFNFSNFSWDHKARKRAGKLTHMARAAKWRAFKKNHANILRFQNKRLYLCCLRASCGESILTSNIKQMRSKHARALGC
jgi:hypothetical protein